MLVTIVLTTLIFILMILLASGAWATAWPWIYFVRDYEPKDESDSDTL